MLFHLDYIYNKGGETEEGIRWRCQNRAWPGFLFINLLGWIDDWEYHSHGSMASKIKKLKFLATIKERALSSTERSNDIIIREIAKLDDTDDVMLNLPHISSMRDLLRRERNTKDGLVPGKAEDIPEILRNDSHGDPFLRFDQGVGKEDRFVIFFSKLKLEYMKYVSTVLIDGTFRSTPQGFYQVLVIYGLILGHFYPLCYILLRDKCQISYEKKFGKVC